MYDEIMDMERRIHRLEDVLLRSNDIQEKLRIHEVLMKWNTQLSHMKFEVQKKAWAYN